MALDENGRLMPNRPWPKMTKEASDMLIRELDDRHIGFLPPARPPRKKSKYPPLSVRSLDRFLVDVRYVRSANDPKRRSFDLVYLDGDHLAVKRVDASSRAKLNEAVTEAGIIAFGKNGEPLVIRHHATTEEIRASILLPDMIDGQPVKRSVLARVAQHELVRKDRIGPMDAVRNGDSYLKPGVAGLGLTASQYIRMRYAYLLLQEFSENMATFDRKAVPQVYYDLYEKFSTMKYDNWARERLPISENAPFAPPDPDAYDVLTSIHTPAFERVPENRNTSTFDRVRLYMGLKTVTTCPDRLGLIKKHQKDLVKIALLKIQQTKRFQAYGLPMNMLRPVSMTVTRCDELEFLFELKTPPE